MKTNIDLAKKLRRNQTNAEKLLWKHLRNRKLNGIKFRRQHKIDGFIVDFISFEKRLVIEADGGHHARHSKQDNLRDAWLNENSFTTLRFWNSDILMNIDGVLKIIVSAVAPSPASPPVKGGEE